MVCVISAVRRILSLQGLRSSWSRRGCIRGRSRRGRVCRQRSRTGGGVVNNSTFEKNSWYFRNAIVRANYQNLQKGIYKESIHLERFFRNLLMGEDNVLMNRYLHVKAKEILDGVTPTSTPTSLIPFNENIKKLIEVIGENQLSVKEMLVGMGLKDRPNFLEYTLSPAMSEGYVRMLYPASPRHPRQKYLLTVKGLAAYKEIKG